MAIVYNGDYLCAYGCGNKATWELKGPDKKPRYCCSKSSNSCPAVKERKKVSYLLRYGVDNPTKSSEVLNKTKQTNIAKYGSDWVVKSPEFRSKAMATLKSNYGVENPSQSTIIQQKKKDTCINRYGVEHPMKVEGIREKAKRTNEKRYGSSEYFSSSIGKETVGKYWNDTFGVKNPMDVENIRAKNIISQRKSYLVKNRGTSSKPEQEWLDGIGVSDRQVMIRGASGSLYTVDGFNDNTVYEFLGIFWHGHPKYFDKNMMNPAKNMTFGELYEKTKSRIADLQSAGFTVVALWEDGTYFNGEEE